jgi:hypothetical protein
MADAIIGGVNYRRGSMDANKPDRNRTPSSPDTKNAVDKAAKSKETPNPPRTTAGGITSPKFGSAGSGGAELEPGPERD